MPLYLGIILYFYLKDLLLSTWVFQAFYLQCSIFVRDMKYANFLLALGRRFIVWVLNPGKGIEEFMCTMRYEQMC